LELFIQCGIFCFQKNKKYHTLGTAPNFNRKKKKYHTVGTAPNSNRKTKNSTQSEQLQTLIVFFIFLLEFGAVPTVWYSLFFY
jgi:hypothetical protein